MNSKVASHKDEVEPSEKVSFLPNDDVNFCQLSSEKDNGRKISDGGADLKKVTMRRQTMDEGYSWIIWIAGLYLSFFCANFGPTFGIQFGEKIKEHQMNNKTVALILNFYVLLWWCTSAVTGPLINRFGERSVALATTFLTTIGFISLAFLASAVHFFFAYSVAIGITTGITQNIVFIILPKYFNKRRYFALSSVYGAIGTGQIIQPLTIRFLRNNFGYTGGMLIQSGFLFNCCVAAALLRSRTIITDNTEQKEETLSIENKEVGEKLMNESLSSKEYDGGMNKSENLPEENTDDIKSSDKHASVPVKPTVKTILKRYTRILSSAPGMIYIIAYSLFATGFINYFGLVPLALSANGYTFEEAAWILSCAAMVSTVGRFVISLFTDQKWFNKVVVNMIAGSFAAIPTLMFPLCLSNLDVVFVLMSMWGLGTGITHCLRLITLIDAVGLDHYNEALGTNGFFLAVICLLLGFLMGIIGDATKSYVVSFYICGGLMLTFVVLCATMPLAKKCQSKTKTASENEA